MDSSNDPRVAYEKDLATYKTDLARYNELLDSGINPLNLIFPTKPTEPESTTVEQNPQNPQNPQKPQKDISDAKSGEVWTARWYIGDGKYDAQDYNITGVKNGQIHTNHKNESVINIGTIWKKKDAGTAGGKKTKKNKRTKTKKRKTNSKRKRRMKKTVSKR
jgi:hypothetical protein